MFVGLPKEEAAAWWGLEEFSHEEAAESKRTMSKFSLLVLGRRVGRDIYFTMVD